MSPYSKQVYFYDSDSHSTDDLPLVGDVTSPVLYSSQVYRKVGHHPGLVREKMSKEDSCHGLLWWLPKASKQPRLEQDHRSAGRPQLVADPFLKRAYGQTSVSSLVESNPAQTRQHVREDSTNRRALVAPDLHRRGGVPDSDSSHGVQDSTSRRPATAHTKRLHSKTNSNGSRVSTTNSSNQIQSHKSSNINNNNNIIMTPQALDEIHPSWDQLPRSRSIAIVKRHRTAAYKSGNDSDDGYGESPSDTSSTERMYDWATWCMYNRIIDHRRNSASSHNAAVESSQRPLSSTTSSSSQQFVLSGDNNLSSYLHGSESQESLDGADALESPWDYCHDGEVFELEI